MGRIRILSGGLRVFAVRNDGQGLLKTLTTYSQDYDFLDEDSMIYSDTEEPWPHVTREEFTDRRKNLKQPDTIQGIRVQPSCTKVKPVLQKMATLVQQQKATLERAGVSLPSSSTSTSQQRGVELSQPEQQPSVSKQPDSTTVKSKVTGAVPKRKFPSLPKRCLDCPICGKSFQQHSKMAEHYVTHTKKSDFTCTTCQTAFTTQLGLDNHIKLHTMYKCPISHACLGFFDTKEQLQAHLDHSGMYAGKNENTICDLCLKAFTTRDSMLKHKKHRCMKNPSVEIEFFFCRYCQPWYRERKYITQHETSCPHKPKSPKKPKGGRKGTRGGKKK